MVRGGEGVVTVYTQGWDLSGADEQTLRQGILVHDLAGGRILHVPDLPGLVRRRTDPDQDPGRTKAVEGVILVEARGETITWIVGRTITTMCPEGERIATLKLDQTASLMRMDSEERIWVYLLDVRDPSSGNRVTLVFDRDLNELFGVAERRIFSASAKAVLTGVPDSLGTSRFILLRTLDLAGASEP